jgi:MSHA biogenesis protein MshQ
MIISCMKKLINKTVSDLNRYRFIRRCPGKLFVAVIILLSVMGGKTALADTPVTLFRSFAGNINITGTAGTLRTQSDSGNPCLVTNSGTMNLLGLPADATVRVAYLYWAGSGGDPVGGAAADYNVTFRNPAGTTTNITADRTFTASFANGGSDTRYFFQGVTDVTSMITGNGSYTVSNLTVQTADVNNGGQYCSGPNVLSAFSLVVVYDSPSETLHVVNLWEGFEIYWGSYITLSPSNFVIPNPVPANSARHLVLTWEGDYGNSGARNGQTEQLTFCAPIGCTGTALTDGYNPGGNQFNSTVDVSPNGPYLGPDATWGVDLDLYNVTTRFHAGDGSAAAVYSSGQDMVILANQTMSVPNVPVADLAITKSDSGNFLVGSNGFYTLNITNNGPSSTSGTVTVSDTLPTGLVYVSGTGTGWSCSAVGQVVTCTRATAMTSGESSSIVLTVSVGGGAVPSVTNTVTVTSGAFDNVSAKIPPRTRPPLPLRVPGTNRSISTIMPPRRPVSSHARR